jgi:hypothetical protein
MMHHLNLDGMIPQNKHSISVLSSSGIGHLSLSASRSRWFDGTRGGSDLGFIGTGEGEMGRRIIYRVARASTSRRLGGSSIATGFVTGVC